jgi:hypothetical protein
MASLLPNGKQQFETILGTPLVGGSVYFYAVGTEVPKDTWQDQALTILNTNPVVLDARGQAVIWGAGNYRQIVNDRFGITIWDQVVTSSVSDGDLAGSGGAAMIGLPDGTTLADSFFGKLGHVVDSIALLRAVNKTFYSRAFVTGYDAASDGGGGPYQLDPNDTASADNGVTIIVGADGGRWKLQLTGMLSAKQAGAKGDGTTDDSTAIQRADAAGETVFFPDGAYCGNNLSMTVGWHMSPGAKIQYNGATEGVALQCAVDGLDCGDINIDCNGLEPLRGFIVSGNKNKFRSISVQNIISTNQTWANTCLYVTGSYNTADIAYIRDAVNQGNTNDSSPQGVTLSTPGTGNVFPSVVGNNTRSLVVDSSAGTSQFGEIHATDCLDNGFYGVGPGCHTTVGSIFFDGVSAAASAAGFRHSANASIGQIHITACGAVAIFFGDCGDITIGDIYVQGINQAILGLNQAATGKIKIGSIKGLVNNALPFAFQTGNGPVQYLSINDVDLKVSLDATFTGSTRSIGRLDAANGVNIGNFKIDVILNGFTPTDPFFIQFNPAMTYSSIVGAIRFAVWQSDEITPFTAQGVFTQGLAGQQNVLLTEGVIDSNNQIRPYNYSAYQSGRLIAAAIPTVGTFRRGSILWTDASTASLRGWACTATGSPGTWAPF